MGWIAVSELTEKALGTYLLRTFLNVIKAKNIAGSESYINSP